MSRVLYSLCGADGSAPFSPHCWKVVLALKHKGLDFEEKPVGFTEIAKLVFFQEHLDRKFGRSEATLTGRRD